MDNFLDIPTYVNGIWTITSFKLKKDFYNFIKAKIKIPGKYNLKDTHLWRQESIRFETEKYYSKTIPGTVSHREYWDFEKKKSFVGIIVGDFYISAHYYFYLNFTPIYNVLESRTTFPEVWDSHYHYMLHKTLAWLEGKFVVNTKKRRWGLSFLECADIHRRFIFERDSICKLIHREDDPVSKNWRIIENYRTFTNTHTAWKRYVMGSYPSITQQIEKVEETSTGGKKKSYSGLKSVLEAVVTRQQPAKGVGLYLTKGFFDEAGLSPKLISSIKYNEKSVKQGGVVKGDITVGGSVGELKDSDDLKTLMFNPDAYNFYAPVDEVSDGTKGIFIPESWNYVEEEKDDSGFTIGEKKCYDQDGNSDVEGALKAIIALREKTKTQNPKDYRLQVSQGPLTINEAFDEREENIFPTHLILEQYNKLFAVKDQLGTPVELYYDEKNKVKHKFVRNNKVQDFPLKKTSETEGCIMVYEFPIENAPLNLYFAGIDTVGKKEATTATSDSLMACYIIKGVHLINGELTNKEIVAEYVGRYKDGQKTFDTVTRLWEWYNARPLIENNQESYIQDLITQKKQRTLIRKSELSNLTEINPSYSTKSDYGVSTGTGTKIKDYLYDLIIEYLEQPLSKKFDDISGDVEVVKGISRFPDYMALKEMLNWTPKANVDRILALGYALWAVKIFNEMNYQIVKSLPKDPPKRNKPITTPMFRQTTSMFSRPNKLKRMF